MSGIAGTQHLKHPSPTQGSAASGRVDPRLAGVVHHAAPATPRLATDLSQAAHFADKPLDARKASVVPERSEQKG